MSRVDGQDPSLPFAIGWVVLAVASAVVLALILTSFGSGDRLVPSLFVALEAGICAFALRLLKREALLLADTLEAEPRRMTKLGQNGAHLADSLVHMGDQRRDITEEFQEHTATWANLLIILGMVGTAGYLVVHARDFLMQGSALEFALKKLLPLAPKAFSATGLALASAAILGMVGARALRLVEGGAPSCDQLIEAWKTAAGSPEAQCGEESAIIARAIVSAFDEKVLGRLGQLPELLSDVVTDTTNAVEKMGASIEGLTQRLAELAGHFTKVAADSQAYLGQSREVMEKLVVLAKEATNLLERLRHTEEGLSESASKTIEEMHRVLETYQQKLVEHAADQAPRMVSAALSPTVEAFGRTMEESGRHTAETIRGLAVQSFGEAHRVFTAAVSDTGAKVEALRASIQGIDQVMGLLDTKLRDASTKWAMPASEIERILDSLRQELERFAQTGVGTHGAVQNVAAALEQATLRLGERADELARQIRVREVVGELAGALDVPLG
jgi:hypothetical protein